MASLTVDGKVIEAPAGAPLVAIPLVASTLHFVLEARFNRTLLQDVAQRPDLRMPKVA